MLIQTGVTVRKRLSWLMSSVTLTFDIWPWPFAWTSPLSLVITPENVVVIRRQEHSEKGVTDRQTDRRTDGQTDIRTERGVLRAAWSQLKIYILIYSGQWYNPDSKVNGAHMGPSGADRTQVGPMLAPWTLLSGKAAACAYSKGYI